MKNMAVAKRYAKALFQLATETGTLDDVLQGMSNLRTAIDTTPDLKRLLLNPIVKVELKKKLVSSVTSNKTILRFTELLAKRKRLDIIGTVFHELQAMSDDVNGVHRALVRTALPLSDAQKKEVELSLSKTVGGKFVGRFEVMKELIGGVWIQMGDKVLDATLKGRIDNFRHALLHSTN